jgi:hypothetical protein
VSTRHLAAAALLAALAASARAADPLPPTAADLSGARAVALSGARGLAGGNEAIFLNAASLAARRRYSIEGQYQLDRFGGSTAGQWYTLSAVDSETGSVAGGFAYSRIASGPSIGNVGHASLATAITSSLFAGITGKYLSMSGAENMKAATMDVALFARLGRLVSAGFSGYNLVDVHHPEQAPRAYGGGIAVGDDRRFHVTADYKRDLDRKIVNGRSVASDSWGAGVEWLVGQNFPLRAGLLKDDTRDLKAWSVGAGLVSASGGAIDVTYRQSINDPSDRTFAVALKLFVLEG